MKNQHGKGARGLNIKASGSFIGLKLGTPVLGETIERVLVEKRDFCLNCSSRIKQMNQH